MRRQGRTNIVGTWKAALLAAVVMISVAGSLGLGGAAYAADPICKPGEVPSATDKCIVPDLSKCQTCDPSLSTCKATSGNGCVGATGAGCSGNDCGLVAKYLNPIITFLAGAAGLVATISIVIGGIQYASSADDPGAVSKAKSRIINALLALLAFFFLWAFLQFLIPGGIF